MTDKIDDFYYDRLGHNSLKLFVETIRGLISHTNYDLIIAGGDSGNIMAWITNDVYKQLKIDAPAIVVLPIYRHADYEETILFDNRILKSQIKLPSQKLENILLVDDEVGSGNTVRGLLEALGEVTTDRPRVTFVAENENFDPSSIDGWNIEFKPPQMRYKDVYNAISYIVPYNEYQVPVKKVLEPIVQDMNDKHVMATLLDLPIKEWNDGNPEFTFKYRDACMKQIDNFGDMQKEFQHFMHSEIAKILS